MKIFRAFTLTALIASTLVLCGCYTKFYQQNDAKINHTQAQMNNSKMLAEQTQPVVVTKSGFYVDTQPISLSDQPLWTRKVITLRASRLPFNLLMNRLLRSCPVVTSYDNTVQPTRLVSMNYSGTIEGALETLAAQTDYGFITGSHDIRWSAFETRTFNISFMPGSSNYLVGQQQNSTGQNTSSPGYSGTPIGQINDQQYSNLEGQLSLWQDLSRTLNQLKSEKGHIVVSESTTSVTVHDRPSNVRAMAQYIAQLNNNLSQQVAIKVQVLEVQLNKEFNYGIDWNAVINGLGTRFNLTGDTAAAANITQNLVLSGTSSSAPTLRIGKPNGSQTLISLLSQQGKVRVVTEPEIVTMNNQIASIRITQNIGYVESISSSQSQNFLTTSVTPGSVTDGFTLYILPKIEDDQVYLQITSTIANLEKLEKVSTAPTNSSNNASSNSQNNNDNPNTNVITQQQYQAIQVPTVSQKAFNQRSTIISGSTLIIAGYKRLQDAVSKTDYFGVPPPVGGEGATSDSIETLVLITPIILHSSQSNVHIKTR